jgi:hypothetical protein
MHIRRARPKRQPYVAPISTSTSSRQRNPPRLDMATAAHAELERGYATAMVSGDTTANLPPHSQPGTALPSATPPQPRRSQHRPPQSPQDRPSPPLPTPTPTRRAGR